MKALVKYALADGAIEVREIPEPEPSPGRVLVEVDAVGVCGSDVHMWHNHQSWPVTLPLVMGHEIAGRVVDTGGVPDRELGERVVVETAASVCGRCTYCLTGRYNLCPYRRGYGAQADGAFRRYLLARPPIVHAVPEGVNSEHAALAEPACVAYNALVERIRIRPGDVVVVQGAGAIGVMATQMARIAGAGAVVVIGTAIDALRLAVAREVGATHTVNLPVDDPLEIVRGLGDGFGADVVVDATGVSVALRQSLDLVRPLGTVAKVGWGPTPFDASLDPLVGKAVTLAGSFSHSYQTWERVLQLMATGALRLDPVIGGRYPLDDWAAAFTAMEDGRNVKSILTGFHDDATTGVPG